MYALDANTLIYYFKGVGNVAARLQETPPREVAIPAIVLYELEVGAAKSTQPRKRLDGLLELRRAARVLPFDEEAAHFAAGVRVRLERAGKPIGPLDTLIAGTALRYGATLVTHNTAEFSRVPGLRLADWY